MIEFLQHEIAFRGDAIVRKRAAANVLLCGCGALGSWLSEFLVRQGYSSINVLDFDRVEAANYGTQNYGSKDVGRKKAAVLAANIFLKVGVKIASIDEKLDKNNIAKHFRSRDLVIDAFDNADSRNMIRDHCKAHSIPCLHVGLSADGFAEIEWNEDYRAHEVAAADPSAPCDYPLASNLVFVAVSLAAECVNRFVEAGTKKRLHFTLKDLHIHCL